MGLRIQRILFVITLLLAAQSRAADNLPRMWTNNLGVKREATFVRAEGNDVTLLLNNGQLVTMPLDRFSAEDQRYVHDLQMKAVSASFATPTPAPAAAGMPAADSTATTATSSQGAVQPPSAGARAQSPLLRPAPLHAPDPSVQPKAELHLTFPELGKSRTDEPLGMYVRIPENYRPDKPVPLIVWMAGGDGSSRFNEALNFVNKEDFVLVGINYPADPVPVPQVAAREGHIYEVWAYQERMLAKLQEMIPNIDPRLRIVVGFSNGAHMIGACLGQGVAGMTYFNVFVLIEGGLSDKYDFPQLPGRYFYVTWGDASIGGRGPKFGLDLADNAKKAGMKVEAHALPPGVGHDFPDIEKAKVRGWLENVVIPAQLGKP